MPAHGVQHFRAPITVQLVMEREREGRTYHLLFASVRTAQVQQVLISRSLEGHVEACCVRCM